MGGGSWSTDYYQEQETVRRNSGKAAFAYNAAISTKPVSEQTVHANLNPKGVRIRESRDSEEHPESNAIMVFFDVTGSMLAIPQILREKLPNLMDTLNKGSYIPDPQVFFGAVGDSRCDRGSLQVGQFESDNRVNEAFENMWLEGGGGGNMTESYQNAMFFASRCTTLDCFEKRQKKGYLFLIGDEMYYPQVSKREIDILIGDGFLQADLPTTELVAELKEKFHVYMIIPTEGSSHGRDPRIHNAWKDLLGERVLFTDDIESICEIIAMAVGLNEGVSLDKAREDLQNHGSSAAAINRAASSLSGRTPDVRTIRL